MHEIRSRDVAKDLFYIISLALILRILPALLGSPDNMDVILYKRQAMPIINNQNIYQVTHRVFPYSPITMFIPAMYLLLADKTKIPFHIIVKILPIMGDVSLAIAIYYWTIRVKNDRSAGFRNAILYAVNPLAILISSFQGNIMSIPTLFMFLAVMTAIYDCDKNYRLSALLLGLAIAFRSYPVLLLPLVLLKSRISFSKKIKYILYSLIPTALAFIPFLLIDYKAVFREIFGYSGFIDYGFAAVGKAWSLYYFIAANKIVWAGENIRQHLDSFRILHSYISSGAVMMQLIRYSKVIFLSVYLIVLFLCRRFSLVRSVLMAYLGFYFFYSGISSQYLIWIIPFLYFLDGRFSIWYIILATYAVISVYLCYYPPILFGRFSIHPYISLPVLLANEFIALSFFWSLCGIWFFSLLFKKNTEALR